MGFAKVVLRRLRCPPKRVVVVEDAAFPCITDIGVVIIIATWSGPALRALEAYSTILATITPVIPVWMFDNDQLTEELSRRLDLPTFHGEGEVLFYRDGKLVAQIVRPFARNRGETFANTYAEVYRTTSA